MAAPRPRAPGKWFRTGARPGSRACDSCKRPVAAGEEIAYRTHDGPRRADVVCRSCAEREPYVDPGGAERTWSIWDEAARASTPEARGQVAFTDALLAGKTIGEAKAAQEAEAGPDWAQVVERAEQAASASWEAAEQARERLVEALHQHGMDRDHLARCRREAANGHP